MLGTSGSIDHLAQSKWEEMRKVSCGASISLLSTCFGFVCYAACAEKAIPLVGHLGKMFDSAKEPLFDTPFPNLFIRLENMQRALGLLSEQYSVALIDVLPSNEKMSAALCCFYVAPRRPVAVLESSLFD